jgi:hypothetical protein
VTYLKLNLNPVRITKLFAAYGEFFVCTRNRFPE